MNPHEVARELLESARLKGEELDVYLERASNADYWTNLVPALSVGQDLTAPAGDHPIDAVTLADVLARFEKEGYLQLEDVFPPALIERMLGAVTILTGAGWPAIFSWVYDEFWWITRFPVLRDVLGGIFGAGYRQTPYVWTHVVGEERGSRGWIPHVDNPKEHPRVTMWIPLTDATVDSGCISVIPKHLSPPADPVPWHEGKTISVSEALGLLYATRPLPALKGSVLCWGARVVHWGSARRKQGAPRVSISIEFAPARLGLDQLERTLPRLGTGLPSLSERLRIIGATIQMYQNHDASVTRFTTLAERLRHLGSS